MEISNRIFINNCNHIYPISTIRKADTDNGAYSSMPNCCPVYFSPSFTAMKKKEFEGVDSLVVEKFKPPIQSFLTKDDFGTWAEGQCQDILKKEYTGRREETAQNRKNVLDEWKTYIYEENKEYTPAERLLIFDGITKGLGKKDESMPPELNKGVLAQTIYNLKSEIQNDPNKKDYNFNKAYQNNLRVFELGGETSTGTDMTGWVKIPSKKHDPENFENNVKKLQNLSHNSWCTKTYNAEPYLKDGDFHVYLDKGNPRLGVRFKGDAIEEIQGPKNNGAIPFKYYDVCKSYVEGNKFNLRFNAECEMRKGQELKDKYVPLMNDIKNTNTEGIFEKLGIKVLKKDKNGLLTISHFEKSKELEKDGITFEDLGINLNKLMKNVKEIKGNANFKDLNITRMPNLQIIGGDACFEGANIDDLSSLLRIKGEANFKESKVKKMGKLTLIDGDARFYKAEVEDLGGLEEIRGNSYFDNAIISNLSKLRKIVGTCDFNSAQIDDLSGLKELKTPFFFDAKIGNLSGLEKVDGEACFHLAQIDDLSGLKLITGKADFGSSNIGNLSRLEEIKGDAYFSFAKVKNLSGLKVIEGNAKFNDAQVEDLSGLTTIGRVADFSGSVIGNLKSLVKIGGSAYFKNAKIGDMSSMSYIGGKVDENDADIKLKPTKPLSDISMKKYNRIKEAAKTGDTEKIFKSLGVDYKSNKDGTYTISHFTLPLEMRQDGIPYDYVGLNVNELMKNVAIIEGNAVFRWTDIKQLPKLKEIGGSANFAETKIKNLKKLEKIGGTAYFDKVDIKDLSRLNEIGGHANFHGASVADLSGLHTIGQNASFDYATIGNLKSLKTIGLYAYFGEGTTIEGGLPALESIGRSAYFEKSSVTDLSSLTTIGEGAYFEDADIEELPKLRSIGEGAEFKGSKIKGLPELRKIGYNAEFSNMEIDDLGNLVYIGNDAKFERSKVKYLGKLKYIGGDAKFERSKVKYLGKLKYIGGDAEFESAEIGNLESLEVVGKRAHFQCSKIGTPLNLKKIWVGDFRWAKIPNFDELKNRLEHDGFF